MKQKATPPPSRGFTLVEVIVVLGIIIGLSTVVFGYVQSAQTSSEVSRLMRDADFFRSAVVSYGQQNNGDYKAFKTGATGTKLLVNLGLLPPRFKVQYTADNKETGNKENPFGARWLIVESAHKNYSYRIQVVAPDIARASLKDKWDKATGSGDGSCKISSYDNEMLECAFPD